jgi:purine nucleoside phosphorylase
MSLAAASGEPTAAKAIADYAGRMETRTGTASAIDGPGLETPAKRKMTCCLGMRGM